MSAPILHRFYRLRFFPIQVLGYSSYECKLTLLPDPPTTATPNTASIGLDLQLRTASPAGSEASDMVSLLLMTSDNIFTLHLYFIIQFCARRLIDSRMGGQLHTTV